MLVLSRKRNEEVIVGEGDQQVSVTVVEIRSDKVCLGFNAPKAVPVHRREVFEVIQLEGEKKKQVVANDGAGESSPRAF